MTSAARDRETVELVTAIRQFNPTAPERFLRRFEPTQLRAYLRRLEHAQDKRLYLADWLSRTPRTRQLKLAS